jgi:hypothetical protein
MRSPSQGAATPIHLASAPELVGASGRYYVNCKPRNPAKPSYDESAAAQLWQVSADLVGVG